MKEQRLQNAENAKHINQSFPCSVQREGGVVSRENKQAGLEEARHPARARQSQRPLQPANESKVPRQKLDQVSKEQLPYHSE